MRLCSLPRWPHELLQLDLTHADRVRFGLSVLLAAELAGAETVKETVRDAQKSAEAASAMLLGRLLIER